MWDMEASYKSSRKIWEPKEQDKLLYQSVQVGGFGGGRNTLYRFLKNNLASGHLLVI